MTKVSDILDIREEVLNREIDGVLKSYKVDSDEDRLENSPEKFFEITYPSNTIKNVFDVINDKLQKKISRGNIILAGPYGSGKTHCLIALYHLFNKPELGNKWLNKWNLDLNLPLNSKSILISLGKKDYKYLWEPIFLKKNREDLIEKVEKYPGTDLIEEFVGNEIVIILLDEIETWYQSFNRDNKEEKAQVERNRFFLQNLFEVATDKKRNLFVILTYLDKETDLDEIINRENPFKTDIAQSGDKHKIIFHRLFKTERNVVDWDKIEKILNIYLGLYDEIILENTEVNTYRKNMMKFYPFHPQCIEVLNEIYEIQKDERQNLRGLLGVLADVVAEKYKEKDLFLLSDLEIKPFRLVSRQLVSKTQEDINDNSKEIKNGKRILKTVLFYTLNDRKKQASKENILLSTLSPGSSNRDEILFDLEELIDKTFYMHTVNGNLFEIKDEKKWAVIIDTQIKNISKEDAKNKITELLKDIIKCDYLFDTEIIPDSKDLKIICVASHVDKDLNQLDNILKGKEYQNRYIFIIPKTDQSFPFEVDSILNKAKRIIVQENLIKEVDAESKKEIYKLLKDDMIKLNNTLTNTYGEIIRWIRVSPGKYSHRTKPAKPIKSKIKAEVVESGKSLENSVFNEIDGKNDGIKISSIINDFYSIRGKPIVENDSGIYNSIKNLYRDKRIVILKERGKFLFPGRDKLSTIKDNYLLFTPEIAPNPPLPDKVEKEIMKLLEKKEEGRNYKSIVEDMTAADYNFHLEEKDIEEALFALYNKKKFIVQKNDQIYRFKEKKYSRISESDIIIHHLYDPGDPRKHLKVYLVDLLNQQNYKFEKLKNEILKKFEKTENILIEILQDLYNKKEIELIDESKIRIKKPDNFPELTSEVVILKSTGLNIREFILSELDDKDNVTFENSLRNITKIDSTYSAEEIISEIKNLFNQDEIEIQIDDAVYKPGKDEFPAISEKSIISRKKLLKTETINCLGNPRSVSAELEARIMQTDKIRKLKISLTPEKMKKKKELLDFVEKLFDGKVEIEVEIEKFED